MTSPFGPLVAIVDLQAGGGRVRDEMPELERQLQTAALGYRFAEARGPEEATRLTREALAAGDRYLVAVGDDATVNAVANGMIEEGEPVAPDAVLGVVAAGTPCDFIRTFGLPGDVIRAARHLRGDRTYPIDVGRAHASEGDAHVVRYFVNLAEAGLGGAIAARAGKLARLGRSRAFFSFWMSLIRHKPFRVTVRADRKSYMHRANNVIVANGQYTNGGMRMSPRSYPGDGLFDVQISIGPRSEAFTLIPKFYRGEHIPGPTFKEMRGALIAVEADRPLPVHVDGRVLGTTPAAFSVIPQAIRLKI